MILMMQKRTMHIPTLIFLKRNDQIIILEIALKVKLRCNKVIYKQVTSGKISDLSIYLTDNDFLFDSAELNEYYRGLFRNLLVI